MLFRNGTPIDEYLNKNKSRTIENTSQISYNCGGYALRTYSWYFPYNDIDDNNDYIAYYVDLGYSINEGLEILLKKNVEFMLQDFKGLLRIVDLNDTIEQNEELIAFRLGADYENEYDDDYIDIDFHFRVFRGNCWKEKVGGGVIRDTKITNEPWDGSDFYYTSSIVYLAKIVE